MRMCTASFEDEQDHHSQKYAPYRPRHYLSLWELGPSQAGRRRSSNDPKSPRKLPGTVGICYVVLRS